MKTRIPNISCNVCNKHVVDCDCPDIVDRLKSTAEATLAPMLTNILAERLRRGKDLPKSCCKPGCALDPVWIPVISVPGVPRKPVFLTRLKTKIISAELLNMPLCELHKSAAKFGDLLTVECFDRGFEVGDQLLLQCWNPETERYLGTEALLTVTYVMRGPVFGLMPGWVIMGFRRGA